jgi:hypothetical protein
MKIGYLLLKSLLTFVVVLMYIIQIYNLKLCGETMKICDLLLKSLLKFVVHLLFLCIFIQIYNLF